MGTSPGSESEIVRGDSLPPVDHIINAVRADLLRLIAPDVRSESSKALIDMMDLLLRNAIMRLQGDPAQPVDAEADVFDAIDQEVAALNAQEAAETKIEPLRRAPEREALFDVTPERLTDYLRRKVPGFAESTATSLHLLVGGLSKNTFLVDIASPKGESGVVLRRDIQGPPIDSSAPGECDVLAVLFEQGLPVPEPLIGERDPSVFGMPFQIARRLPGRGASSAVEYATFDGEGRAVCVELAKFLARLHSVDIYSVPLRAERGMGLADYAQREVEHWESWWRRNQMTPSPILQTAYAWLRRNLPKRGEPVIVHGDAGLHNLLMHEGKLSAMLDWELVHIGGASEDILYARTWVERVMPFEDFVSAYEAAGGHPLDESTTDYYELFNFVRNVTCTIAQNRGFRDAQRPLLPSAYSGIKWYRDNLHKAARKLHALKAAGAF